MNGDHDHDGPGDGQPRGDSDNWPALDVDAAFAAIVARLSNQGPEVGPWPASEDLDDTLSLGEVPPTPPPSALQPRVDLPPRSDRSGGRHVLPLPAEQPTDDEERFVPPEPPPLPHGDALSRIAWAAVIGGPLFLLVSALAWRNLPTWLLLTALGAFIGGFVTLVARMPGERPDDGDGAVV